MVNLFYPPINHAYQVAFLPFRAAVGAIFEFKIDITAALYTGADRVRGRSGHICADAVNILFTPIAHEKGGTLFHAPYRYKKQTEIMVDTSIICLMKTANRAADGILIKLFGFGLHPGNEYKRKHFKSEVVA